MRTTDELARGDLTIDVAPFIDELVAVTGDGGLVYLERRSPHSWGVSVLATVVIEGAVATLINGDRVVVPMHPVTVTRHEEFTLQFGR